LTVYASDAAHAVPKPTAAANSAIASAIDPRTMLRIEKLLFTLVGVAGVT
jgi:hypothetical protein